MVTVDELLEKYRSAEMPERDKGTKFERLMKNFLLTNPVYRGKFSDVWLWNEFPFRDEFGTVDLGIDIVCKAIDGEFWAVHCKFYAETSVIDKAAVDLEKLDAGTFGEEAIKNFREPKEHQLNAIDAAKNYFQNHTRGKLIMACGTGKTYTSLKIAEKLLPNGKILFLVPSISLLGQILYEWATFAEKNFQLHLRLLR